MTDPPEGDFLVVERPGWATSDGSRHGATSVPSGPDRRHPGSRSGPRSGGRHRCVRSLDSQKPCLGQLARRRQSVHGLTTVPAFAEPGAGQRAADRLVRRPGHSPGVRPLRTVPLPRPDSSSAAGARCRTRSRGCLPAGHDRRLRTAARAGGSDAPPGRGGIPLAGRHRTCDGDRRLGHRRVHGVKRCHPRRSRQSSEFGAREGCRVPPGGDGSRIGAADRRPDCPCSRSEPNRWTAPGGHPGIRGVLAAAARQSHARSPAGDSCPAPHRASGAAGLQPAHPVPRVRRRPTSARVAHGPDEEIVDVTHFGAWVASGESITP